MSNIKDISFTLGSEEIKKAKLGARNMSATNNMPAWLISSKFGYWGNRSGDVQSRFKMLWLFIEARATSMRLTMLEVAQKTREDLVSLSLEQRKVPNSIPYTRLFKRRGLGAVGDIFVPIDLICGLQVPGAERGVASKDFSIVVKLNEL
jgi:hypothetical protein